MKFTHAADVAERAESPSLRRVWVEITVGMSRADWLKVTLLAEGVG